MFYVYLKENCNFLPNQMQTVGYSLCPKEPWLLVVDEAIWDHRQLQVASQLFHHPQQPKMQVKYQKLRKP